MAAYRGGCTYEPFKPFFKFAIRSRIRERLLLDIDSIYNLAKQVETKQNLENQFIAFVDPKTLSDVYVNYKSTIKWLHELQSLNIHIPNPAISMKQPTKKSYTDLIAVYNKLVADGIIVNKTAKTGKDVEQPA